MMVVCLEAQRERLMMFPASRRSGTGEKKRVSGQSIDVDWMVDYAKAREIFDQNPNSPSICGNADPVSIFYQGTPEEVYRATWKCLEEGGDHCFIAAGCEIPDGTPTLNILMQNRAIKEYSEKR